MIVQLNPIGRPIKLLHLTTFAEAIGSDPDLASIAVHIRTRVLQVLYVATGSDFFVGIGKVAFLKGFFSLCSFYHRSNPS